MGKLERILELIEEFAGSGNVERMGGRPGKEKIMKADFFKNPTLKEMGQCIKTSGAYKCVRFSVDFKKKELIIWPCQIAHREAMDFYSPKNKGKHYATFFMGRASLKSGKLSIDSSDFLEVFGDNTEEGHRLLQLLRKSKVWLSKYISNVDEFAKSIEDRP